MNDLKFHIENIKRSIDVLANEQNQKETALAITELMEDPNFQILFNLKLQRKVIHERELSELLGLKRGSIDIADQIFQFNHNWNFTKDGNFMVRSQEPDRTRMFFLPYTDTFVFRVVEADDDQTAFKGVNNFTIGFLKPGDDTLYKVQFVTHLHFASHEMVTALKALAPDFTVFVTKM